VNPIGLSMSDLSNQNPRHAIDGPNNRDPLLI
jgi:hypothetical protein